MDSVKLEPIEEAIGIAYGISTRFSYSSNVASRFDKKQCDRLLEILYEIAYPETSLEEGLDKNDKDCN